jgi:predicted dehydrogenase
MTKIGFIGGGDMTRAHALAFGAIEGVTLVGITNRTRAKAEAIASDVGISAVYDSIEEMWATAQPDIVVLAVYEPAIEAVATEAFKFPWTVFMEKPIGLDLAAAKRVTALASARSAGTYVGLNRRYLSSTRAVSSDFDARPDELRHIVVSDQQSLQVARDIGHSENVVQNWMYANSIHLVDYLCNLARGELVDVTVLEPWTPEAPTRVVAHLRYSSGDTGLYTCHWNAPGPWAVTAVTPSRRWEMRPLEAAVFQNGGERALNPVELEQIDKDFKPGFGWQAARLVEAIKANTQPQVCTIQDALIAMETVAKIYGLEGV